MNTTTITLTVPQLATVLAGLRLRQCDLRGTAGTPFVADVDNVATSDGLFDALGIDDIDTLCEQLNTPEVVGGDVSHLHLYQRTYSGFVRIHAIVVGTEAANAAMTQQPGLALLSALPGDVALLADISDTGVPQEQVPPPAPIVNDRLLMSPELVDSILSNVIESGLDEWFQWSDIVCQNDDGRGTIYVSAMCAEWDADEGEAISEPVKVDAERLAEAFQKMLAGEVEVSSSIVANITRAARAEPEDIDLDAWDADCIVQVAVFGEIRYS